MTEQFKKQAALAAISDLRPNMRIGLGTGSTARHFVEFLGARVKEGFECVCVPTSIETEIQARALNIPLSDLDTLDRLDLTVDGADEIDRELSLIKGGGGALLREKIVASASDKMIVIADQSKLVQTLGVFPLPVEVNPFGLNATRHALASILDQFGQNKQLQLRQKSDGTAFVTDGGHYIFDTFFGRISDARTLSSVLLEVPGIVQHGLFLDICTIAYIAGQNGVIKLEAGTELPIDLGTSTFRKTPV